MLNLMQRESQVSFTQNYLSSSKSASLLDTQDFKWKKDPCSQRICRLLGGRGRKQRCHMHTYLS